MNPKTKPQYFVVDVDGVMTTGHFIYTSQGKVMKIFGPDDNDGLSLLNPYMDIHIITGDKKGFPITQKRIADDMGYKLDLVSTIHRIDWIKDRYLLESTIYMGDGIFDHYVMKSVAYSIAPSNADKLTKKYADFITERSGGDRAVAEACLHILSKFFEPYNPNQLPKSKGKMSGEWNV